DSISRVAFNKIDFHPYFRYRPKLSKQVTLTIHKPQFPAQELFSSFPEGLFSNLDGLRVKGNLSWYLNFFVDLDNPDSLQFETSLDRYQFSVQSYGNADLTKINGSFLYTAYEHDVPVRTFMVGPENPDFRTLEHISPYLQSAVLTSEDGGFYQHRGFLADAFRESIIANIKEGRFVRGGSTISMQLVKNVFLSRNKTVGRKLEEALIVWLIENQGLCTKDRMFEVYLNIIEWGPMIYGANEASHYYFNKEASRLTLAEAIFMSSIIPRPKWFKYSFNENGHLRESNEGFYRLVSEKMLNKGWITPADAEKLIPDVELKGRAKLLLRQVDAIHADSTDL
ncbi:MAG: transglycosylase domain-containing protein, partial [Bacteroidales bacterium]